MIKPMLSLLKRVLLDFLSWVYYDIILSNRHLYYGNYYHNNGKIHRYIKMLFRWDRWIILLKYKILSKQPRVNIDNSMMPLVNRLKSDGVIFIENFANGKECDEILTLESNKKVEYRSSDGSITQYKYVPLSRNLMSIWIDSRIREIVSNYFGRKVFGATYPHIHSINPLTSSPSSKECKAHSQINASWHYDNPLYISCFLLLHDVGMKDSHMQVLKGTHRVCNVNFSERDRYLSDEYVNKKKFDTIDCVGKKGTLVIFDATVFHRLKNVRNSPRTAFKFEISCGNDLNMNYKDISNSLCLGFDIESLNKEQRDFLSGLYPEVHRGYGFDGAEFKKMNKNIY